MALLRPMKLRSLAREPYLKGSNEMIGSQRRCVPVLLDRFDQLMRTADISIDRPRQ